MHIVRKDVQNNRLILTLSGVISLSEAIEIKKKILDEAEGLQPGFDAVNNMSKYIHGDERAAPILQSVTNFLVEKKVKRVVRVIGTSKKGLMQFAKYTQPNQNVNIHYFPTMKEAEDFLNNK